MYAFNNTQIFKWDYNNSTRYTETFKSEEYVSHLKFIVSYLK